VAVGVAVRLRQRLYERADLPEQLHPSGFELSLAVPAR
jgi:hypothetical protein